MEQLQNKLLALEQLTAIKSYIIQSNTFLFDTLAPHNLLTEIEFKKDKMVLLCMSDEILFATMPISRYENTYIVLGPFLLNAITAEQKESLSLIFEASLDDEFYTSLPIMNIHEIIHILTGLNVLLNQIALFEADKSILITYAKDTTTNDSALTKAVIERRDFQNFTEALNIYECIKEGDTKALFLALRQLSVNRSRINQDVPIQTMRYQFVAQLAIASQYAVNGGLPSYIADELMQLFIRDVEFKNTVEDIAALFGQAYLRFCKEVESIKNSHFINSELSDCIRYIGLHINSPITLNELAERYGYNPTYFSRKFKNTYHITVERFILLARLSESKRMLQYTDKSISEISYYLCFSSQSHFHHAFKKEFQMTPNEYRSIKRNQI